MKEQLFQAKKRLIAFSRLQLRKLKRLFVKTSLSREASFSIPIVLNNRNRYTYLKEMVDWLQGAGYKNIIILDNDSDYPALLEYYRHTTARVIFLKRNVGYKALWETDFFETIKGGYYVYSDADLMPGKSCPSDVVYQLYKVLSRHRIEKCGPALRIDDLPEHYSRKQEVLDLESDYWKQEVEKDVFDAPVDTTFALYKPYAKGNAEECRAYRVAGDLTFIHLPWYEDSAQLPEEAEYYKKNASSSSSWYTNK